MGFNKKWLAIIIFLVVVFMVFLLRNNNPESVVEVTSNSNSDGILEDQLSNQDVNNTENKTQTISTQESLGNFISLEELSKHNTLEDCWISYNNKVYDITSYLPRHPGTSGKILPYCGSADEFKAAFEKKHGTSKVSLLMKVGTFIGDFDVVGKME